MGTRATIIKEGKGNYTGILLHSDGYPEYAGEILKTHYSDQTKIDALINLGNLSDLLKTPDECVIAGSWGEISSPAQTAKYLSELETEDYVYLFRKGKWHVSISGGKYTEVK